MQIQRIQSNNTSFGYNPLVNAKLMNDLSNAKKNKAYCEFIKNLCSITNQTELKLRDAEKRKLPQLTDRLAGAFLPIKVVLTDLVDELFPSYGYKNKELETYSDEVVARNLENKPDHWLNTLVKYLHDDVSDDDVQAMKENVENMAEEDEGDPLTKILQTMFPGATIVSTSLMRTNEGDDEIDEVQPEEETNKTAEAKMEELIKIGKDRVEEFIPTNKALKGFDGLGGMKELKAELTDKVVDFLRDPEQAKQDNIDYGTKLPKGLLLYGPPGTGKTTIIKHLAVEAGVPLYKLETGSLKTSYYHETSKNIKAAFAYVATKATPDKPAIILIDDADADFVSRNDRTTQFEGEEMKTFLTEIQEAPDKNIMVALTTNKYDILDKAISRRFDTQVYVGLPDEEARISLLKVFLKQYNKGINLAENEDAIKRLAKKFDSFPISAIEDMTAEACDIPKREAKEARKHGKIIRRDATEADFEKVLAKIENQNKKINEKDYKSNATRPHIGF